MSRFFKSSYFVMIYGFLYLPILILIVFSFNSAEYSASIWEGFTLNWYKRLITNKQLINAALNTLAVAASSATLATVIGTLGAVSFFRFNFYGKGFLYALIYIVMMAPEVVMGIALLILFTSVHLPLGFTTLVITHTTFSLPFVLITLFTRLSGFDKHLVESAKDLGADEFATFRYIILPMLLPAVAAGWLLSFTISMDDAIGSPFVTDSNFEVLPIRIFSMVKLGVKPDVNALSAVMFFVSIIIILTAQFLMRDRNKKKA